MDEEIFQAQQAQRRERFIALMKEHYQEPDDYDEGEEEDPRPFVDGRVPCERYVVVTANPVPGNGESKTFFLPIYDTLEAAKARAIEFAQDDVFAEIPVAIVDLESDARFLPNWTQMPWVCVSAPWRAGQNPAIAKTA